MNLEEIMLQLQQMGNESIKKVLVKHGAKEPFFGVKREDLKKIQKHVKVDYQLSLALYETGNSDAMYLAGLIADPSKMTRSDLNHWVEKAYWYMLSEYTVAWVASESELGFELALEWIDSEKENIAASGWATLSSIVSIRDNELIDKLQYKSLLDRVMNTIHSEKNRVRAAMNIFVISAGGYCADLTDYAIMTASSIGKVKVDMGGTACKVPLATEYIFKMHKRGLLERKRKSARC